MEDHELMMVGKKFRIFADDLVSLTELLAFLDPKESVKITFLSNPNNDTGDYILTFENEVKLDCFSVSDDVFNRVQWIRSED